MYESKPQTPIGPIGRTPFKSESIVQNLILFSLALSTIVARSSKRGLARFDFPESPHKPTHKNKKPPLGGAR